MSKSSTQAKEPTYFDLSPEERHKIYESNSSQELDDSSPSYVEKLFNAIPNGAAKALGSFINPNTQGSYETNGQYERRMAELQADPRTTNEKIDEKFPLGNDIIPNIASKATQEIPFALTGAGSVPTRLGRAAIAASADAGLEDLPLPDLMKFGIRNAVYGVNTDAAKNLAPGSSKVLKEAQKLSSESKAVPEWVKKRLNERIADNASKKEIFDFASKHGLTPEEVTPLLQTDKKQKWLAHLAKSDYVSDTALKKTQEALGRTFDILHKHPDALTKITPVQRRDVISGIQESFKKMPELSRKKIAGDYAKLIQSDMTPSDIMTFHKNVNSLYGENTKQLAATTSAIKESLRKISPGLGQDFDMANKLYSKYKTISDSLKPSDAKKFFDIGSDLVAGAAVVGGVMTGSLAPLLATIGEKGARKVAQSLLINPKWQRLSAQMVSAINQNNIPIMNHIKNQMANEMQSVDPEAAALIEQFDAEAFLRQQ